MPDRLVLVRTTPELTDTTVPAGLRRAHRVATGVWGRLRVLDGDVRFVFEGTPATAHELRAGDSIDIPPGLAHHVEPGTDSRFLVEFHAPIDGG